MVYTCRTPKDPAVCSPASDGIKLDISLLPTVLTAMVVLLERSPSGYDSHSHGKSLINGGFNGKNIFVNNQ